MTTVRRSSESRPRPRRKAEYDHESEDEKSFSWKDKRTIPWRFGRPPSLCAAFLQEYFPPPWHSNAGRVRSLLERTTPSVAVHALVMVRYVGKHDALYSSSLHHITPSGVRLLCIDT